MTVFTWLIILLLLAAVLLQGNIKGSKKFIIIAFLIVALLTRKVSAGSMTAAVAITVSSILFAVSTPKLILAICAMCLALFQHRENFKRLLKGTEPDFKAGKKR